MYSLSGCLRSSSCSLLQRQAKNESLPSDYLRFSWSYYFYLDRINQRIGYFRPVPASSMFGGIKFEATTEFECITTNEQVLLQTTRICFAIFRLKALSVSIS